MKKRAFTGVCPGRRFYDQWQVTSGLGVIQELAVSAAPVADANVLPPVARTIYLSGRSSEGSFKVKCTISPGAGVHPSAHIKPYWMWRVVMFEVLPSATT